MASTVSNLSSKTRTFGENLLATGVGLVDGVENALNETGDYTVFGSNDRRHGYMGLLIGPVYESLWKNLAAMISTMLGMEIGDYCNFNDRMYGYMTRLMLVNLWEHNTTLSMLGDNASGNSKTITHEALMPAYTQGNNYLETVRDINADQGNGIETTTIDINVSESPYKQVKNLFPDDLGLRSGEFNDDDVWTTTHKESILYKTKKLFMDNKINTLISRFATNADGVNGPDKIPAEGNARTMYGLSHGNNLLTKEAEKNGGSYDRNGYNNPYCRVWTHHYQYDKFSKTIRPFQGDGKTDSIETNKTWNSKFKVDKTDDKIDSYGWKSNNEQWNYSVMNGRGDGLVNIAPHFGAGKDDKGNVQNIHPKDCMFSIENLAWKDYDPYSFEKALSWEQRGPLGGRIMWFPPYGLTFQETTNAQWNSNTFIGRGEDVYTYVSTKRSGTLSFYMITDHPSIVDYVSWYEANRDFVKDTDILRYFAGCDSNDPNDPDSLLFFAHPTPLTDEEDQGKMYTAEEKAVPVKPEEQRATSQEKVQFNVYFPNNYSGYFDINNEKLGVDFVIEYLLAGTNAQQTYKVNEQGEVVLDSNGNVINEEHVFNTVDEMVNGVGYEMEKNTGISTSDKAGDGIIGNKRHWYPGMKESVCGKKYEPDSNKIWRYRIDGEYKVPACGSDMLLLNTYDETIKSYKDTDSKHLNSSLDEQYTNYNVKTPSEIPDNAYTFTEVVEAIAKLTDDKRMLEFFEKRSINHRNGKVDALYKIFNELELGSVDIVGYSSAHGHIDRNEQLSKNRAETIKKWLESKKDSWRGKNTMKAYSNEWGNQNKDEAKQTDENVVPAKVKRCVSCTLTFVTETTVPATDAEEKDGGEFQGYYKVKGQTFADHQVYKLASEKDNPDSAIWVYTEDGFLKKVEDEYKKDFANETFWYNVMNGKFRENKDYQIDPEYKNTLFNKVRYDQEYYFFRKMKQDSPMVFNKLMDKLQYFSPAFHSMTPEGFNTRLTFLNQCTRQGNTVGVSDPNRVSASNLAFGRPPFCVLRIGDFYNQMIVIHSITIEYDVDGGIVWDLNDEGAGVQPMLARISINFDFIGGSDMGGAVRRLQNAQSFNYYANASLYDNRASRVVYNDKKLNMENSVYPSVENYNPDKIKG